MKTRIKAATLLLIVLSIFAAGSAARAQFGIGASGGISYPGLMKSESTDSHFNSGWGYELFLTHTLFRLSDSLFVDARYSFRQYKNPIVLPIVLDTWFTFRYLTLTFLTDIYQAGEIALFTGIGGSLLTSTANNNFFEHTGTSFIPEINLGLKWIPTQHYTIFSELSLQFGALSEVLIGNYSCQRISACYRRYHVSF